VGALTEDELNEAQAMVPGLAVPLQSPPLRRLLRNPFFLKMAAQMKWEGANTLPLVERDFRRKVWREVVERVDQAGGGLPLRRGKTYAACARRRAELLTPYVSVADLDAEAVEKLVLDGLLVTSPLATDRVAPAHDVLEDWALLDTISTDFAARHDNLLAWVQNERPFPAMRRAFGKWIDEWIEAEPAAAAKSVLDVLSSAEAGLLWQDEALAAILRSAHAPEFISVNQAALLDKKGALLFRAVHLCRIVATQPNPALSGRLSYLSGTRIPIGTAWSALIKVLRDNQQLVTDGRQEALVASFLEDWSRQVTWQLPYPDGSTDAAQICLTEIAADPDSTDTRKFAETLVKFPLSHPQAFADTVRGMLKDRKFNRYQPGLPEMMLNGLKCLAVCRDTPDLVIDCLREYLYPPQERDVDEIWGSGPSREVEAVFGLRPHSGLGGGQASAHRGPYMHLLNNHPEKAIALIIETMNLACDCYGKREYQGTFEVPELYEFELPNGKKNKVWGSWRLWGAYRGGTVMPKELECALMALEMILIQRIDMGLTDTEAVLTTILEQTNNVALVAVVASIACYAPEKAGLAAYSVLTNSQFYEWDLARKTNDPVSMEDIGEMFPNQDVEEGIYISERKQSRQRPHRAISIEDLCRHLQGTQIRDKVFTLLDNFHAEAIALGHADERNVVWLNIVQRMDVRKLVVAERRDDGMVLLQPEPLPDGFNEQIQQFQPGIAASQKVLNLLNWGMMAFRREFSGASNTDQWKDMLAQVRALCIEEGLEEDTFRFLKGAAGYIAATVIRDHLAELPPEDLAWCQAEFTEAVQEDADTFDDFVTAQRNLTSPSRPASTIIPYLAKARPSAELNQTLALALTHPVDEVRSRAIGGFRGAFADEPDRAKNVLGIFVEAALKYDAKSAIEKAKPFGQRIDHLVIQKEVFLEMRRAIADGTKGDLAKAAQISVRDSSQYKFFPVIANWMVSLGDIPPVRDFFRVNAAALAGLYANDKLYNDLYGMGGQAIEHTLAQHLLQIPIADAKTLIDPLLASMQGKPDKCGRFFELIILAADRLNAPDKFWPIWGIFASAIQSATPRRGRQDDGLAEIIKGLFMVIELNEGVDRWSLLAGHEQEIVNLFSKLPPSRSSAGLFLTFLRTTGKHALEAGLVAFEKVLKGHPELLTQRNVETMEFLLGPPIYSTPARLKKDAGVRTAVLVILDAMIKAGSTASYFMRNDFATPSATG
jgi:hypothetical protein